MFTPCKYKDALKCSECTFAYHRQCKKFVVARAKDISREIQPFVYNSKLPISGNVTWSKDINRAKSVALNYGRKLNADIKKYSMSQVISMALQSETTEAQVIYIEHATKLAGDLDKLKGVLSSFIESATLHGACVSIYIAPSIQMTLDYNKL